jgi:hypothetical protein
MRTRRVTPWSVRSPSILTLKTPFSRLSVTAVLWKVISGYLSGSMTISRNSRLMICFCCSVNTSRVSASEAAATRSTTEAPALESGLKTTSPAKSRAAMKWSWPLNQSGPPEKARTTNLLRRASMR